ncbi:hypothetical protein WKW50_25775, partial [Ochrobactrum sp. GPK 3]
KVSRHSGITGAPTTQPISKRPLTSLMSALPAGRTWAVAKVHKADFQFEFVTMIQLKVENTRWVDL